MNKQRKTSHILNVFQYDHATGIIGLNGAPVSGYGLYLTTNINDGSVGIDSSASINALYLLKNTTKQFEISYDTSGAAKIFRLLPYQSGSFFQIGNPSNAANSNSDYVFISESVYGNVLIGPGIGNGTGNLTGATASIHKVQFNGAVFANNSIQATSFKITGGASTGFLKADGTVDAVTYLSGNQSITVSGDATGSGTTSIALTLANTAVTPGTYGSTTLVPVVTVDSKGRITSVTTAAISGSLTFTGDVTGTGTTGTSTAMTLAASGVTAGTYTKVTVDSKGRVTVGASATTSDISEGTNLYYTDARVLSYLSANTYATQSYVNTQVSNLVAAAPATLDTLNELAAALGNDPSFATTISTALGNRLRVDINNQGLSGTLQGYGRTNLGLGTAATSNTGDFVAYRTFGTAANSAIGDFVAYRTFGTAANNNTGDFAAASHTHSIANVTGLQTALDGKQASGSYAASVHTHIISDVTGLQTALDGKQASLGYTPYNSTNPSGYITSSALSSYLPLTGGTLSGNLYVTNSSTVGAIFISGAQVGARQYMIHNGITGISNSGLQIRDVTGNANLVYFDTGYNAGFGAGIWATSGNFSAAISASNFSGSHSGSSSGTNTGDQTNISGTAGSISGFNNPTTAATANTIVYRDASGDIAAREFVLTAATVHTVTPSSIVGIYPTTNQVVKFSASAVQTFLGLGSNAYSSTTIPTNNNQLTNGAGYITGVTNISGNAATTSQRNFDGSLTSPDFYASGWFRTSGATAGLYNSTHNTHFYASGTGQWNFATSNNSWIQIALRPASHESTVRGYLYADTNNNVGLLTYDGNWGFRVDASKNAFIYGTDLTVGNTTSSNIYMTDTDETTRRIHCNSGRIGFLNSSASWGAWNDNTGNWRTDFSMYASSGYFYASGGIRLGDMWGGNGLYAASGAMVFGTESSNDWIFSNGAVTKAYISGGTGTVYAQGGITDTGFSRILTPKGGYYQTTASSVTGAIKITQPFLNGAQMSKMTVKIYEYITGKSFTITVCGHRDGNNWYNVAAYQYGDTAANDITVRFGHDGTYNCIWIGETGQVWSYPQVFITDIQNGYSSINSVWNGNWSISFVDSFNTVMTSRVAKANASRDGTGASGTWGINVTGTAGSISGFNNPTTAASANTIVYRDTSGHITGNYIFGSYFNSSAGNSENPTIGQIWTQSTGDNYLRKSTPAHFISQLGLITSSNIGSQSVATATTANNLAANTSPTIQVLNFTGVGTNSGNANQSYAIYQEGGAWSPPFPDLCIGYHTGIKLGAYYGYNGIRFFNNSDFATQTFSVNDGDNHVRVAYNLYVASDIVYNNMKFTGDQTYGFLGRNVYADTINGRGSDPLELNYYDGGSVIIGTGANGSKALYAGSLYDAGNRVYSAANPQVNISGSAGSASTAGSAGHLLTAYAGGQQTNPQVYFNNGIGLKAAMTGAWSVWSDTLWINGYSGGDVLQMCALHTLRNGTPRMAISVQASTSTSYGTFYEFITTYNMASQTAGNTNSISNALGNTHTWTGAQNNFLGNGNTASTNNVGLVVYSTGGNGAQMSFHRSGAFAVNMGLDSDNVFRIGGWSAAANRLQLDMSGNLTVVNVNATNYYMSGNTAKYITNFAGSHTAIYIGGSQSAYSGFTVDGGMRVMVHTSGVGAPCGFYHEAQGWSALFYVNGTSALFYAAAEKITTQSYGVYVTGEIRASSDITAYYSDIRLKKDIDVIPNAIEKIKKLRGVTYTWNEEEVNVVKNRSGQRDIGLIAQEVEAIEPLFTKEYQTPLEETPKDANAAANFTPRMSETYKTIKYDKLVALLVEGMKEQQLQIEELKNKLDNVLSSR